MAEYTEHYAIAKHGPFGGGEALSAYSIVNVAMDTIDSILWEHQRLIDALEERMDNVESELVRIENKFDAAIDRIDQSITEINNDITEIRADTTSIWNAIEQIVNKIIGGGDVDGGTGDITWPTDDKVAIGTINLYSGSGYIRSTESTLSSPGTDDVRVQ